MSRNFEKLIEYIINSDETNARKLFHEIVVSKSRSIYESMEMANPTEDEEEVEEAVESYLDEVEADEIHGGMMEADDEDMAPETDDMGGMDDMADVGDMGDVDDDMADHEEHGDDAGMEDRVVDLEDAIEELKAEFEKLMSEEDEEGAEDEESEEDESEDEESEEDESEEDESEEDEVEESFIREYTEKAPAPVKTEVSGTNTKSTVAGKNDMGGTAKNLVQGGDEKGRTAPKSGSFSNEKFQNAKGGGTGKPSAGPKPVGKEEAGVNKGSVLESKKNAKKPINKAKK
jgi:hypothetical protein